MGCAAMWCVMGESNEWSYCHCLHEDDPLDSSNGAAIKSTEFCWWNRTVEHHFHTVVMSQCNKCTVQCDIVRRCPGTVPARACPCIVEIDESKEKHQQIDSQTNGVGGVCARVNVKSASQKVDRSSYGVLATIERTNCWTKGIVQLLLCCIAYELSMFRCRT